MSRDLLSIKSVVGCWQQGSRIRSRTTEAVMGIGATLGSMTSAWTWNYCWEGVERGPKGSNWLRALSGSFSSCLCRTEKIKTLGNS